MPTEPSVFRKESELAAQGGLHAEIERMRVDLSNVRIQQQVIRSGLQIARAELKADIATLRAQMTARMSEAHAKAIFWFIGVGGQIVLIALFVFLILKFRHPHVSG